MKLNAQRIIGLESHTRIEKYYTGSEKIKKIGDQGLCRFFWYNPVLNIHYSNDVLGITASEFNHTLSGEGWKITFEIEKVRKEIDRHRTYKQISDSPVFYEEIDKIVFNAYVANHYILLKDVKLFGSLDDYENSLAQMILFSDNSDWEYIPCLHTAEENSTRRFWDYSSFLKEDYVPMVEVSLEISK